MLINIKQKGKFAHRSSKNRKKNNIMFSPVNSCELLFFFCIICFAYYGLSVYVFNF